MRRHGTDIYEKHNHEEEWKRSVGTKEEKERSEWGVGQRNPSDSNNIFIPNKLDAEDKCSLLFHHNTCKPPTMTPSKMKSNEGLLEGNPRSTIETVMTIGENPTCTCFLSTAFMLFSCAIRRVDRTFYDIRRKSRKFGWWTHTRGSLVGWKSSQDIGLWMLTTGKWSRYSVCRGPHNLP